MTGVITQTTLYEDANLILFIVSVTEGTQAIADIPLIRENIRMGEYDKQALIKTAIDIAKYRINSQANKYQSQSEVENEFNNYWWDEEEVS